MEAYGFCSECESIIKSGEKYWSINLHQEVYEEGAITVLQALNSRNFCENCATIMDFEKIIVPKKDPET